MPQTRRRAKAHLQCHFLESERGSGASQAQPNSCKTNWLREKPKQPVTPVDNRATGPVTLDAVEREMQNS